MEKEVNYPTIVYSFSILFGGFATLMIIYGIGSYTYPAVGPILLILGILGVLTEGILLRKKIIFSVPLSRLLSLAYFFVFMFGIIFSLIDNHAFIFCICIPGMIGFFINFFMTGLTDNSSVSSNKIISYFQFLIVMNLKYIQLLVVGSVSIGIIAIISQI